MVSTKVAGITHQIIREETEIDIEMKLRREKLYHL